MSDSHTPPPPDVVPPAAAAGNAARDSRRPGAFAALFLPAVVFLGAPNSIVFANLADLPYRWSTTVVFAIGLVASVGLLLPAFLACGRSRAAAVAVRCSLGLGLAILLFDAVDAATATRVRWFVQMLAIDAAAAIGVALLMRLAPLPALVRVFAVIGPVLVFHGLGFHAVRYGQYREAQAARSTAVADFTRVARPTAPPDVGNVYHIVLDAFQPEAYTVLARERPDLRLADFTEYTRFVANYDFTVNAVPGLIAGRYYQAGTSVVTWRRDATLVGFWGDLYARGMRLALYPQFAYHASPLADTLRFGQDVEEQAGVSGGGRAQLRATVDLWFLHVLPRSARLALNHGWETVTQRPIEERRQVLDWYSITDRLLPAGAPGARVIRRNHTSAHSPAQLDQMLADEEARPGTGQYVFLHLMLPHSPYVLDCTCRYTGLDPAWRFDQDDLDAYMEQAACALRLVHTLVDRLRALGRYDDALIVLHADHGAWPTIGLQLAARHPWAAAHRPGAATDPAAGAPGLPRALREWRTGVNVKQRSRTLLLVKYPGAREAAPSPVPAQMLDVGPTILEHVGAPTAHYPGRPLQSATGPAPAETFYFTGRLPKSGPLTFLPLGGTLSAFALAGDRWEYRGEVPVVP